MSIDQTLLLGALAGSTIFLGLPLGRVGTVPNVLKVFLNGVSAGILLFLLVEILEQTLDLLEQAVEASLWMRASGISLIFVTGLAIGLLSLHYLHRARGRRKDRHFASISPGPGAMALAETSADHRADLRKLGISIAAGIGLHNFSEAAS